MSPRPVFSSGILVSARKEPRSQQVELLVHNLLEGVLKLVFCQAH